MTFSCTFTLLHQLLCLLILKNRGFGTLWETLILLLTSILHFYAHPYHINQRSYWEILADYRLKLHGSIYVYFTGSKHEIEFKLFYF